MIDRESLIARLRSNAAIHRDVLDAAADMLESEAARFAELEAEVARLTSDRMDVSDLTADAIEANGFLPADGIGDLLPALMVDLIALVTAALNGKPAED